jgi:hypothetical protein
VLGSNLPDGYRALARELIDSVLPALTDLRSLRAQAYLILAFGHLRSSGTHDIEEFEQSAFSAATRLVECFHRSQRPDWQWFESRLTYANAVLPHALFVAAQCWPREDFGDVAETAFAFLDRETTADNLFWPIGNSDWYSHGESKSLYDQQPLEAVTTADAALAAFGLLQDDKYLSIFCRAHDWFQGRNSLKARLVDPAIGACFDGLLATGPNLNQGAESTLAYLWSEVHNLEMQVELENVLRTEPQPAAGGQTPSYADLHVKPIHDCEVSEFHNS